MEIAGIVLVIAGLVIVVAAEATARGPLGINGMIGIRFGALLMSDRAWHLGHRAARVPLDLAGVVLVVSGVLVLTLPISDEAVGTLVLTSSVVTIALVVLGAVIASREANRVLGEDDGLS
jgi:uncharacterized membrane protein